MRGRTLNDAFDILDEAQNTTAEQMKMFLSRLGFESKAVITGDVTQIDLPNNQRSGLREAETLLRGIEGIAFCNFTEVDVVRHPLVQAIIKAYAAAALAKAERAAAAKAAQPAPVPAAPAGGGPAAPPSPCSGPQPGNSRKIRALLCSGTWRTPKGLTPETRSSAFVTRSRS